MKAAFLREARRFSVEDVVVPSNDHQVLVDVLACGICGSDLHGWNHPNLAVGVKGGPTPGFTGHEIAVRVVGAGDDSVAAIEPNRLTACGTCDACTGPSAWFCRNRSGREAFGFAEQMVVPEWALFPLPDGANPEMATLVEPLACAVHTLRSSHSADGMGRIEGVRVGVIGAGVTGILTAAAARHLGAAEVVVTARHPHQAKAAQRMGATATLDAGAESTEPELRNIRPDLVVECVGGAAPTLNLAMKAVRAGGEVAVFGLFDEPQTLDTRRASMKELRLFFPITYGVVNGLHDFDVAIEMLTSRSEDFASLITHRYRLDEIGEAFATEADKAAGALRVVVTP